MTSKRFAYYFAALLALALAVVPANAFREHSGASPEPDFIPKQLQSQLTSDVDRFSNTSDQYLRDWAVFQQRAAEIKKKGGASVSAKERSELGAAATALNRQLDVLVSSLGNIVQKLKDNQKFTAELDSYINAYLRAKGGNAARLLPHIEQDNGPRALFGSANQLFSDQRAATQQLLRDAISDGTSNNHARSLPANVNRFVCGVLTFKLIVKTLRGNDTPKDADDFVKQCGGAATQ